nr:hypothetical protein [Tanacetum cinerariifolium]
MESNKSIHQSDEQRNLYKALVEAYESEKIILDTYGDIVTLKRRRDDDADKDKELSVGSDRGTTGKSTQGSKSQQKTTSESALTEEPMQTTQDLEEPSHQEFETGVAADQPIAEASQHPEWFQQQKKPPTPDHTLTLELLAGPTYELMKGSCKSLVELEFFLEEVYKVTTDLNSEAHKEYYAVASGAAPPNTKASIKKMKSSFNTTITPPTAAGTRFSTSAKGKQPAKASKAKSLTVLFEVQMKELVLYQGFLMYLLKSLMKRFLRNQLTIHEEEVTKDEESFDPIFQTHENSDDDGNNNASQGLNVGSEEGQDTKDDEDELYRDVNINLAGRDVQMTDVHTTQEFEDTHVTLTLVNPDGQQQSSVPQAPTHLTTAPSTLLQDLLDFGSLFGFDHRLKTLKANFFEFVQTNQFAGAIIKEQVKEKVKVQVSKILPKIEKTVNEQLEAEVLTHSSNSSKTSYVVAANLSEMELKKILIEKMESNKFAVNRESARDVYSKHRIITVTELQNFEWHNYKHLDWITMCRDDDKLYKFKEGDFKRLHIQDIRDLGVESYQKKLNLTEPNTYRSDLKYKEAYTTYSNPRGFIYQNKDKQNRLMRIDELHKFSDGTLNDVQTALDDRLKGIRMKYLPQDIWRKSDKERAATMIQAIDKQLKTRRIMCSVEKKADKSNGQITLCFQRLFKNVHKQHRHPKACGRSLARAMSSPSHPTSNIEDAFSSNFPDYILASPDYVPASPGNTYSSSSNNSFGLVPIASLTLSLFHNDPYMKVMHAYYAKELPIPPPVIMPPFLMLSPMFNT